MSIEQLRDAPDAELIATHDAIATNTAVGISYFLDELQRREFARAAAVTTELSRRAYWLTIANTLLAVASVAIAIIAIAH